MNPLPAEVWERGMNYSRFRESIEKNLDVFDELYEQLVPSPEAIGLLRRLPPLRLLAIGEDWCPDVFHTLSTWARISRELPGWEMRIFKRDEHPDVMDCFLWQGRARRIPVYAFYDERSFLQVWWSGRSARAQQFMDDLLGGRLFADLEREERTQISRLLEDGYRREFRQANFEEIVELLRAFYHLSP